MLPAGCRPLSAHPIHMHGTPNKGDTPCFDIFSLPWQRSSSSPLASFPTTRMPGVAAVVSAPADFMVARCVPAVSTALEDMLGVDIGVERCAMLAEVDVMLAVDMRIAGPVITVAVITAERVGAQQPVRRPSVRRRQEPTATTAAAATPTATARGFARDNLATGIRRSLKNSTRLTLPPSAKPPHNGGAVCATDVSLFTV